MSQKLGDYAAMVVVATPRGFHLYQGRIDAYLEQSFSNTYVLHYRTSFPCSHTVWPSLPKQQVHHIDPAPCEEVKTCSIGLIHLLSHSNLHQLLAFCHPSEARLLQI
jgi:hypothetical protein